MYIHKPYKVLLDGAQNLTETIQRQEAAPVLLFSLQTLASVPRDSAVAAAASSLCENVKNYIGKQPLPAVRWVILVQEGKQRRKKRRL